MNLLPKAFKQIRNYWCGSTVRYVLEYLWALLSSALLTLANSIPSERARRAISTVVTVIAVIVIIALGIIIIVYLVVIPGVTTSTSVTTSTITP